MENFLCEIKQISESLTLRMDRMDRELAQEIRRQTAERGSSPYYRNALALRGLVNITTESNDMFDCKELILENRQFETSSNFEIDEHQNFVKIRTGVSAPNFGPAPPRSKLPSLNVTSVDRLYCKENRQPIKPPASKASHRRVYESILERFSTASLIAMNREDT